MATSIDHESVERLAKRLCSQENEIWEEAGYQNRRRWIMEARTTLAELKGQGDE